MLPKFNGEGNVSVAEHIRRYESILRLFNVIHKDVACRLFSFTFEGKASLWFYFLPLNSISSWLEFKNVFRDSFENYDIIEIHQNLNQIQVHERESIWDFNTRFHKCITA